MLSPGDQSALRASLDAAGVFRHHEAAGWARLVVLFVALAGWIWCVGHAPLWVTVLLAPLAAGVATTAAMMGHEGSHGSFSRSKWQNTLLTYITYPLLTGLSATYWKHKHDAMHHGHPNVRGQDPDVSMWPFIASREDYEKSSRPLRWVQRNMQGYLFWPMTPLLALAMRRSSIRFFYRQVKRGRVDARWWLDVGAVVTHYVLWLGLGSAVWGLGTALAMYALLWGFVGMYLAFIFAPGHVGLPILADQHQDWLHQLETTRNFTTAPWFRWVFVGLDFQIEHHLYPRICHQELPRAQEIVSAWCADRGLPYHQLAYGAAVASVTQGLQQAWKTPAASREELRAATTGAVPPLPIPAHLLTTQPLPAQEQRA